jgi:hypothetical protein
LGEEAEWESLKNGKVKERLGKQQFVARNTVGDKEH